MDTPDAEPLRRYWVRVDPDTAERFKRLCRLNGKSMEDALGDGMRMAVARMRP